jgi:DNA (cytosine-5)-methyltransferase 1
MFRVINELKPRYVIGENVAGLLSHNEGRTFGEIIEGLENKNYEVLPVVSPASNNGAAFEGKRVFFIATSKSSGYGGRACKKLRAIAGKLVTNEYERCTAWGKTERRIVIVQVIRTQAPIPEDIRSNYGFPDWMDRIKSLGNTVVPQQVYPIFKAVTEIERMMVESELEA